MDNWQCWANSKWSWGDPENTETVSIVCSPGHDINHYQSCDITWCTPNFVDMTMARIHARHGYLAKFWYVDASTIDTTDYTLNTILRANISQVSIKDSAIYRGGSISASVHYVENCSTVDLARGGAERVFIKDCSIVHISDYTGVITVSGCAKVSVVCSNVELYLTDCEDVEIINCQLRRFSAENVKQCSLTSLTVPPSCTFIECSLHLCNCEADSVLLINSQVYGANSVIIANTKNSYGVLSFCRGSIDGQSYGRGLLGFAPDKLGALIN